MTGARRLQVYRHGARPLQPLYLFTSGFDDDSRELWEIPEVRAWCGKLYGAVPFVFSLLAGPTGFDQLVASILGRIRSAAEA